jgi:hypothetical protein
MPAHEILLTLFYFLLFNFLIYRFRIFQFDSFKPFVTSILFNLKFLAGIFIWFIYTFYYTDVQNNDAHKFYNDALILRDVAQQSPTDFLQITFGINSKEERLKQYCAPMKNWERNFDEAPVNENRTIIRLNALLMFVSMKAYMVHVLFMCFISLWGWKLLVDAIMGYANRQNALLAIPVMLLPSVLFWTSGVMKEPLLILGMGLFFNGIIPRNCGLKVSLLKAIAGFIIILFTKFFVLVCMLPGLVAFYIYRNADKPALVWVRYAAVNVVLLLFALNLHYIIPRFNIQQMLANKQLHAINEADYFKAGSKINIPPVSADAVSILKTSPVALWNTLVRPYLWEGKNLMMMASALENLLVFAILVVCIYLSRWKETGKLNLFLFLLNCSLAYFVLIGICTPVIGNLVRYKAPLMPVFLLAFVLYTRLPAAVGTKLLRNSG